MSAEPRASGQKFNENDFMHGNSLRFSCERFIHSLLFEHVLIEMRYL